MDFWTQELKFFMPLNNDLKTGESLYNYQIGHLASALIIDDYNPAVEVDVCDIISKTRFIFPKDALISGSFVMCHVAKNVGHVDIQYDDIDVYLKSKADAEIFAQLNNLHGSSFNGLHFDNPMCAYGHTGKEKINLIYGVEYNSPADLISRFDIRACSMAIDPNDQKLYVVQGAIEDATRKQITFNPVPRGVSVRRLIKYLHKGFDIEKHQNVFFVELVRSHLYSQELELMTKEY